MASRAILLATVSSESGMVFRVPPLSRPAQNLPYFSVEPVNSVPRPPGRKTIAVGCGSLLLTVMIGFLTVKERSHETADANPNPLQEHRRIYYDGQLPITSLPSLAGFYRPALEITNAYASHETTGWNEYKFPFGMIDEPANDAPAGSNR
jgi:hypothetical protein